MANPQHIEWLLEGVEAWNARRWQSDFEPDFSDFNFREFLDANSEAFQGPYMPHLKARNLSGINLSNADLSNANFEGVMLARTVLTAAKLTKANLKNAFIWRSFLHYADLRGADLSGADVGRTELRGADVRSLVERNDSGELEITSTNLTTVKYLFQKRLKSMKGDAGTLLPQRDSIRMPSNWPPLQATLSEFDGEAQSDFDGSTEVAQPITTTAPVVEVF